MTCLIRKTKIKTVITPVPSIPIQLDYQLALSENTEVFVPAEEKVIAWLSSVLTELKETKSVELSVRIVDSVEIQQLNSDYRHKDKPTNVLSFPFEKPPGGVEIDYLGDIIICAEVIEKEALEQNKTTEHHWAHMVVHGCLHLYGYDHLTDEEAEEMENLEILILDKMGIESPYE